MSHRFKIYSVLPTDLLFKTGPRQVVELAPRQGCTKLYSCNFDREASIDDGCCRNPPDGQDCHGNPITKEGSGAMAVTHFIRQPRQLTRCECSTGLKNSDQDYSPCEGGSGGCVHAIVQLPTDYSLTFDLTPSQQTQEKWSSILHFSATGDNCCEYGDRIPAIWFHPGTRKLHVRDGQPSNGNDGCDPIDELPAGVPTTFRIDINEHKVSAS